MRIGFWEAFQELRPGRVRPRMALEFDGLVLPPDLSVPSGQPLHGLLLQPMLGRDLEVEPRDGLLHVVGFYVRLPAAGARGESAPRPTQILPS
jgi:hypothetical protein